MRGLRQQYIAIILLLCAAIIAVFALISLTKPEPNDSMQSPVALSGEIVCLPHKDTSGPVTLECAYGLLADDGRYYGLRNYDATGIDVQQPVTVEGDLKPELSEIYDISGTIDIHKISKD